LIKHIVQKVFYEVRLLDDFAFQLARLLKEKELREVFCKELEAKFESNLSIGNVAQRNLS